ANNKGNRTGNSEAARGNKRPASNRASSREVNNLVDSKAVSKPPHNSSPARSRDSKDNNPVSRGSREVNKAVNRQAVKAAGSKVVGRMGARSKPVCKSLSWAAVV